MAGYKLIPFQVASFSLVLNGSTSVKKLYIHWGFNTNPIFLEMLRDKLPGISIETTDFALGKALGAAFLVRNIIETGTE